MAAAVGCGAILFCVGFVVIWVAFFISGCPLDPYELELLGLPPTCRSAWESEAAWVVGAIGYGMAFALAPAALVVIPVWSARRSRRRRMSAVAGCG